MKTKSVKRAITAIALMLAVSMSANAQLGGALKKAAEKAKSEVKKETSNKATEKVTEKAVEAAPESVKQAVPEAAPNVAPQASKLTPEEQHTLDMWNWAQPIRTGDEELTHPQFSLSLAQLKAAHRKLDPKLYNPASKIYIVDFKEPFTSDSWVNNEFNAVYRGITAYDNPNNPSQGKNSKYAGMDTPLVSSTNYAFATFQADPASLFAYDRYLRARFALDWMKKYKEDPNPEPPLRKDYAYGMYKDETFAKWQNERARIEALHLANAQTIEATLNTYVQDIEKYLKDEKQQANVAFTYGLYAIAANDLQTAPDFDANSPLAKTVEAQLKDYTDRGVAAMPTEWIPASVRVMPATFAMDAASTAGLTAVAKEQVGKELYKGKTFVKPVFINNAWHELKSNEWPYKVVMRSINAAFLFKNAAGEYEIFTGQLVQPRNADGWGKYEWRFGAYGEGKPRPVNYK
jgi:hypothetical protein